jgi:hypothetical protein
LCGKEESEGKKKAKESLEEEEYLRRSKKGLNSA